ncbi:helix-turn-helix domain-containing protein [Xanthovirga aplysinae]|uniref:helix-turn-helix domain-containing protein n=1 Tax=Xanthovirga aplysinae TaxID=2529853 RepID=UPI00165739F0|nr:helix-turn-helix transcriptional regulator [Xanthovirga aplysinae]
MDWYELSDKGIIKEIGERLRKARLIKDLSQQEIANRTGLNRSTISEIERGAPTSMLSFIAILRGLEELESLESLLPTTKGPSPIQMLKLEKKKRQRASRSNPTKEEGGVEW